jgi:hypothetical protein
MLIYFVGKPSRVSMSSKQPFGYKRDVAYCKHLYLDYCSKFLDVLKKTQHGLKSIEGNLIGLLDYSRLKMAKSMDIGLPVSIS